MLEDLRGPREEGREDALLKDERRRGRKGVGGRGLVWSGGGVRFTKLWKDGIVCSIPLNEEDEEAAVTTGGRLSERVGSGLGILQI